MPTAFLGMTRHLMVRFQSRSSGEYGVPCRYRIEWTLVLTTWKFIFDYLSYLCTITYCHDYLSMGNKIWTLVNMEKYYSLIFARANRFKTIHTLTTTSTLSKQLKRMNTKMIWNTKKKMAQSASGWEAVEYTKCLSTEG